MEFVWFFGNYYIHTIHFLDLFFSVTSNLPNCLNPVAVFIGMLGGGSHACAGKSVRFHYGNKGDVLSQERCSCLHLQGLSLQAASLELTAGCCCCYSVAGTTKMQSQTDPSAAFNDFLHASPLPSLCETAWPKGRTGFPAKENTIPGNLVEASLQHRRNSIEKPPPALLPPSKAHAGALFCFWTSWIICIAARGQRVTSFFSPTFLLPK